MTLSTHVLDTMRGIPAAGIAVGLYRIDGAARTRIAEATTNGDGRIAAPFGGELAAGAYELEFAVAAYYAGVSCFFDTIPVRFTIEDGKRHYHVPLLLSPFGYSTYRGS